MAIVRLPAEGTHDLRRRVLRNGTPSQDVTYRQDDLPTTIHLGVTDESGTLVGVSSWAVEAWPDEPAAPAVRLRGMAVEPTLHGGGFGHGMIEAGIEWAIEQGAITVWASARDAVLAFYERCGFTTVGDGFVDEATALPHHNVVRRLTPRD